MFKVDFPLLFSDFKSVLCVDFQHDWFATVHRWVFHALLLGHIQLEIEGVDICSPRHSNGNIFRVAIFGKCYFIKVKKKIYWIDWLNERARMIHFDFRMVSIALQIRLIRLIRKPGKNRETPFKCCSRIEPVKAVNTRALIYIAIVL